MVRTYSRARELTGPVHVVSPMLHSVAIRPDLAEVAEVRRLVDRLAEHAGFGAERRFDIQVAVAEATANAVEHAEGAGEVTVDVEVHHDRLEVRVLGPGPFSVPMAAQERTHRGLGLPLMAALTDHLALHTVAEGGTLVALTFYLPQATRRTSSLAELLAESSLLPEVLDHLPDAFVVFDHDWRYAFVNQAHATLLRRPREELLGRVFADVLPEALTMQDENGVNIYEQFEQARDQSRSLHFFFHDELVGRWFEYHVFPVTEGLAVFARDATEEKRAEAEREELLRQLTQERDRLQAALQREHFLSGLLADSAQPFGVRTPDGRVLLFNLAFERLTGYSGEELRGMVNWSETLTPPEWRAQEQAVLARLDETGEPATYEKEYVRKDGTRVLVELLVHLGKDERGEPFYYSFITDMTERRRAELERERLLTQMPGGFAVHEMVLDDKGRPADYVFLEANPAFERLTGLRAKDIIGRRALEVLPGLEPFWVDTYGRVALDGEEARFEHYAAPLDRSYDVIAYSPSRGRFATLFTDVTERKRVEARMVEAGRLSDALNDINSAVVQSLDFDSVMQAVVSRGARALACDNAAILLREGGAWRVSHVHNLAPEVIGTLVDDDQEGHGLLAIESGDVIAIEDASNDERVRPEHLRRWGIRSALVARLVGREGLPAVIVFNYTKEATRFSAEKLDFVRKLAATAALMAETARQYERSSSVATTLQEALLVLPLAVPGVRFGHAYHSAMEAARLGGDFFDVFSQPSGVVGVIVGDVSGKGVEAAYLASFTRETVRAYALHSGSPRHILRLANEALVHRHGHKHFVTVALALLDPANGRVKYSLAGHPPPIEVSPSGVRVLRWRTGLPLGAVPDASYGTGRYSLSRDDTLLFYTDGITEARQGRTMLGEGGLLELLGRLKAEPLATMPQRVLAEVASFAGGTFQDDAAVLAVKRNEGG